MAGGAVPTDRGETEEGANSVVLTGHDAGWAAGSRDAYGQRRTTGAPPPAAERNDHPRRPERCDYHNPAGRCTRSATVGCEGRKGLPHEGCDLHFCAAHGRRVAHQGCPMLDPRDTDDEDDAIEASIQQADRRHRPGPDAGPASSSSGASNYPATMAAMAAEATVGPWRSAGRGREEEDHWAHHQRLAEERALEAAQRTRQLREARETMNRREDHLDTEAATRQAIAVVIARQAMAEGRRLGAAVPNVPRQAARDTDVNPRGGSATAEGQTEQWRVPATYQGTTIRPQPKRGPCWGQNGDSSTPCGPGAARPGGTRAGGPGGWGASTDSLHWVKIW